MNKKHLLKIKPQYAKLLLAFFLAVFSSHTLYAYDLEVDGIYYNINDDGTSVTVTSKYNAYPYNDKDTHSGDVVIPATIKDGDTKTLDVTAIGDYAFWDCSYYLTSISLPESVSSIGRYAFQYCSSLTSISLPESVTSIGNDAFSDCSSLTSISLPESVTSIGGWTFAYCYSLTSITIPKSVTSIGVCAFSECTSLTSLTIPESVKSIGEAVLNGCYSLTSITVATNNPVYDSREGCNAIIETSSNTLIQGCQNTIIPESVTRIEHAAFSQCSSLTSISIPEGVMSIEPGAFSDCSSLTSIEIPKSMTSIGEGAFLGCSSLTTITVAAGNPVYDSREGCNAIIETSSNTLIQGCHNTIIPEGVTSIGEYAFQGCSSLTSIDIPESVTSIGKDAFNNCSLIYIEIPNSVTSIGNGAFSDCSLISIEIPNSVTSIGDYAFYCSSLKSVIYHAENVPSVGYSIFRSDSEIPTLYVPASALEDYKAADYWNEFEIRAIEDGFELEVGPAGLATYCPFVNINLSEAEEIAAYRATVEDNTVLLRRTYKVRAGEGVLLRSLSGGSASEIVGIGIGQAENEPNSFVGVLEDTWLWDKDEEGNTNFVLSKQEDGTIEFYKAKDTFISAGKAYLPVPNYSEAFAKGLRLVFDDDNATGIDIADAQLAEADGAYYTLSGVKVENPTAKGIYIKNGKKYIIK